MKVKRNKILISLLLIGFNTYADTHKDCLDAAVSTVEISACHIAELQIENQKLNEMLDKAYKESDWIAQEIKQSQDNWIQYMESHCRAIHAFYGNGTMRLIAYPACKIELTKQRQKQLYISFVGDW